MKSLALSFLAAASLEGCTPSSTEPSKFESVQEETAEASKQSIYPRSEILEECPLFTGPPSLNMDSTAFESLTKGLGQEFARRYQTEFGNLPLEERKKQKNFNQLILSSFDWMANKEHEGRFRRAFVSQFGNPSPVDIKDLIRYLNQFLHVDGYHLKIRLFEGVWSADLYRFEETGTVRIQDHLGIAEYPILYIRENLTGSMAGGANVAEGDTTSNVIQFYLENQSQSADRMIREFSEYPRFSEVDRERLIAELTKDTVHHEAVHFLLIDRDTEVAYYKGCIEGALRIAIEGVGTIKVSGCFNPTQIHELCGYGAELEHSSYAGSWTHFDYLGDSSSPDSPAYLFLSTIEPYTMDTLSVEDKQKIAGRLKETGGKFEVERLKEIVGSRSYTIDGTNRVGRQAFNACTNLLKELKKRVRSSTAEEKEESIE